MKPRLQKVFALFTIHRVKLAISQYPSQRGVWESSGQPIGAGVGMPHCSVQGGGWGILPGQLTKDMSPMSKELPLERVKLFSTGGGRGKELRPAGTFPVQEGYGDYR